MTCVIPLPRAIDKELAAEIEKESVYVSPYLRSLQVNADRTAVSVESLLDEKSAEVQDKAQRFLNAMLKNTHTFDLKVFYRNHRQDAGPFATHVQDELKRRGWLYDYGGGQVALNGPALALAKTLDASAEALYRKYFKAGAGMFPAFVNADILARCGYFESHPNAVTFVGHLIDDFDRIEDFRQVNTGKTVPHLPPKDHVHLSSKCLNPAACFPCYPTLENHSIQPGGWSVTWLGRVFRYESRNTAGLERLWEFNVRELVFVGTEEFVVASRQQALSVLGELAFLFDIECRVETATDPFFATVSAAKTFWQQAQEVKYEIRLPITTGINGADRTIAAGSLNLHGPFFGDRFHITAHDGATAFSACVGLGIERWVLAAFAQHGFEPVRWPATVRADIFA